MPAASLDFTDFLPTAKLRAICPAADPDIIKTIVTDASSALTSAGLSTPIAICKFIGQIAAETDGFSRLDENLSFASTARLIATFGRESLSDIAFAKRFVRSPKKLANYVYTVRDSNTVPGDDWIYRGSGLIRLIGRSGFKAVGAFVGMPLEDQPELCREPDSALAVALAVRPKGEL